MGPMIPFEKIFTFEAPFISSASGLLLLRDQFYVVSDDERSLICLPSSLKESATLLPMLEGELPADQHLRKKMKPDFESIIHLSQSDSLLCLASGSTENRSRCALVTNDYQVTELSMQNTFHHLRQIFPELNIEGGLVLGHTVRLFQRGNGQKRQNAIIDLELNSFLQDKVKDLQIRHIDLGMLNRFPLSFTDGCLVGSDCFFLAAAESTESTYLDGEFLGAVLGRMNHAGDVLEMHPIDIPFKPEGLFIDGTRVFVVTDADDRSKASGLYLGRRA